MTINTSIRKAGPYSGNGIATVFPFAFKVFAAEDLRVTSFDALGAATLLAGDVDFIPTLNTEQDANPGGSIALTAPLAVNHTLEITSDISPTQLIDITNQGGFYPQVISKALDKLTILIQQLITNGITSGSIGGVITGARNLGSGLGFFKAKVGEELHFWGVEAGIGISLVDTGNTIRITADGGGTGSGEANTSSNLGTGYGLAAAKSGVNLPFKSLKAGTGVTMSATADEITINSTGGGGGTWDGFANIVDFGAVADFVPAAGGLGTGTSNDTAVMAAIATGKPLYIPDGNYYVANWSTRLAFSRATVLGSSTGRVWGDTERGKQILGNTINVGATNTHEISYGGGIRWSPGGDSPGTRIWTGHHNWMVVNSENGPMQFQLYPGYGGKGFQGITASCEAPNVLKGVSGNFETDKLLTGNHVGWNGVVYKVASVIDSARITVTTFSGASPGFTTDTTPRAFYFAYECAMLKANVSGTTLTRLSGDALPYGYSGDHMYAIINGTRYTVTQGPESTGDASTLTLATSAGTLTNADVEFYRGYGPWAYVTLFRLQGLAGGIETNGGMALTVKNELRIWNGGTDATLFGPIKINATKTAIGPGDGANTTGERFEVESDGVWLGSSSSNTSLINGIKVYGAAPGYLPAIAARGAESNRGIGFDLQGTGKFGYTYNTYGSIAFEIYAPSGANSWLTVTPGSSTASLGVASSMANADLNLSPKGSGMVKIPSNPWLYFSFQNGWTDATWGVPTGFRLDPGARIVRFRGMINGGASGTLVGYLPAGLWPQNTVFLTGTGNGLTPAGLQILSNGSVYGFGSGSPVAQITLDGMTFHLD